MKLLDDKGRIFGIINIIDLLVLAAFMAVVLLAGYKLLGSSSGPIGVSEVGQKEVYFTVKCYARLKAPATAFKPGDQLVSVTKFVSAFIEKVSYENAIVTVQTEDGRIVAAEDPTRVDITVEIKAKMDTSGDLLKLGSQEVAVGKSFIVKTKTTEATGYVTDIDIR